MNSLSHCGKHTDACTHNQGHTHKQTCLVSGGGVGFDSNISLRDKSERELDFLLLGVRTAGHIYLHMEPVLGVCGVHPSMCVCVRPVSGHSKWGGMAQR